MKFSPDTSRLVTGRHYWWTYDARETPSTAEYEGPETALPHHLWGDEVIPPVVEVEPSPPAWVPPVCPAGQFYLDPDTGVIRQRSGDGYAVDGPSNYPPPAWPPRIGEIVEHVLLSGVSLHVMITSGPIEDSVYPGDCYVYAGPFVLLRSREGKTWRWVYRDLSGYVPPGGAS